MQCKGRRTGGEAAEPKAESGEDGKRGETANGRNPLDTYKKGCYFIPMNQNLPIMEQIVVFITSRIAPEKIVLFGSYARGENRENSDIDILILMKNLKNERTITGLLYKELLRSDISIPVDFLAIDCDKYNTLKDKIGYIYKTIEKEGQILYGR
ncbi:MAG: nucleotidyltransferase domain-containing protein [Treponema sp.]|nr:nucleotidyltransferase domain-containing protein [Treponema sp.]